MISPELRDKLEKTMSDALLLMDDVSLERCHKFCLKQLAEVEGEIARRKEQPNEEGGFAA